MSLDPESIPSFIEWRDSQPDLELGVWDFLQQVKPDVEVVAGILALLNPRFVERDGCVLLADNSDASDFATWRQRESESRAVEAQLNHVHLRDMFSEELRMDATFDAVAHAIAAVWRLRLAADFPNRMFVVDVVSGTEDPTGPIVRFWQEPRANESPPRHSH